MFSFSPFMEEFYRQADAKCSGAVLTRYEFCIAFLLIECVRKGNTPSALVGSAIESRPNGFNYVLTENSHFRNARSLY